MVKNTRELAPPIHFRWFGDMVADVFEEAGFEGVAALGMAITDEAKDLCPYDTGHLRSSLFTARHTNPPQQQGTPKGLARFTNVRQWLEKDTVTVGTASGYGGYVHENLYHKRRSARFTRKHKNIGEQYRKNLGKHGEGGEGRLTAAATSGGKRGSQFYHRALARVMKRMGMMKKALEVAFAVRARRRLEHARR